MRYRNLKLLILVLILGAIATAQDLASFEKAHDGQEARQWPGRGDLRTPRGAGVFVRDLCRCRFGARPAGQNWPGAHVRAHGLQRHRQNRHHGLCSGKVALDKVETAYAAYLDERDKSMGRDDQKVQQLEKAWKDTVNEAEKFVKPDEFSEIVENNGGEGLNAFTSNDETVYHYSFPENRLELWAYLESERFFRPVMRQFYKERNVVIEERRMRTDSNPIGRLLEQFTTAAFQASEYHRPTIGWMSDLNSFSATDADKFFNEYYVPSNMVVVVVGDVKAAETLSVIEKYFGRIPSHAKPDERITIEPPQNSERRVVLHEMRSHSISRLSPPGLPQQRRCGLRCHC